MQTHHIMDHIKSLVPFLRVQSQVKNYWYVDFAIATTPF